MLIKYIVYIGVNNLSNLLQVVSTTRENFSRLPIQRFFPLYVAFRIWPLTFLGDYLQQYKVPRDVRISDASWTEFFLEVSERYFIVCVKFV